MAYSESAHIAVHCDAHLKGQVIPMMNPVMSTKIVSDEMNCLRRWRVTRRWRAVESAFTCVRHPLSMDFTRAYTFTARPGFEPDRAALVGDVEFKELTKCLARNCSDRERFAQFNATFYEQLAQMYVPGTVPWRHVGGLALLDTPGAQLASGNPRAENYITAGEYIFVTVGDEDELQLIRVKKTVQNLADGEPLLLGRLVSSDRSALLHRSFLTGFLGCST